MALNSTLHLEEDSISNCAFDNIQIKQANLHNAQSGAFGRNLTVREIRFEYVTMDDIPSRFWAGLSGRESQVLELSYADVGTIQPAAFAGIRNVKVTMKMCNVFAISPQAFSGAHGVASISILQNEIGVIEMNAFGNITSDGSESSFIHVTNNVVDTIRNLAFEGLGTFSHLNVKNNEIGCWETEAFDNIECKKVSIENNKGNVCAGCIITRTSHLVLIIMSALAVLLQKI